MKWTEKYKLGAAETDVNSIASPSAILRYMQDSSNSQMLALKPTYEELLEQGLSFVLSKITVSMYGTLKAHDSFEGETWACPSKGVTFNRCYRIKKDDIIVAEASSVWALLNINERKLCRVTDVELNYGEDEPLELDTPTRFRIPPEVNLTLVGERIVEYADCDLNGHMNNTRYPDILCSYITSMKGVRPAKMSINFVSEAPLGCSIKIYSGFYDDAYYVRTVRDDGKVNAEAEIILEEVR
ncbi:MAG: hypothetical protein IKM46_05075 [Clostridia bacterium]|nr:hypothetical protein [Clostridia bacterium]